MKNSQYKISPRSFKKLLQHFVRKSIIALMKTESAGAVGNAILITTTKLVETYKRSPKKRMSSLKSFSDKIDIQKGEIDYIQTSYIFEGDKLVLKMFIKRSQCNKYRTNRWIIDID